MLTTRLQQVLYKFVIDYDDMTYYPNNWCQLRERIKKRIIEIEIG